MGVYGKELREDSAEYLLFVPQMGQTGLVPFGRILVHDMIIPVDWMKGFVIRAAIQESVI